MNDYRGYINLIGGRIKEYRILSGISQQDLEEKSGVSKRSISRLEQGESVSLENLLKILMALGLAENIGLLVPDQSRRPSYHLEYKSDMPKRVRRKKTKKAFAWGDED